MSLFKKLFSADADSLAVNHTIKRDHSNIGCPAAHVDDHVA